MLEDADQLDGHSRGRSAVFKPFLFLYESSTHESHGVEHHGRGRRKPSTLHHSRRILITLRLIASPLYPHT